MVGSDFAKLRCPFKDEASVGFEGGFDPLLLSTERWFNLRFFKGCLSIVSIIHEAVHGLHPRHNWVSSNIDIKILNSLAAGRTWQRIR